MPSYRITSPAKRNLAEILEYTLQEFGARVALDMEKELRSTMELIAQYPRMGHVRAILTSKPVLFFPVDPYLICYRVEEKGVVIVAIVHGARNIGKLLKRKSI